MVVPILLFLCTSTSKLQIQKNCNDESIYWDFCSFVYWFNATMNSLNLKWTSANQLISHFITSCTIHSIHCNLQVFFFFFQLCLGKWWIVFDSISNFFVDKRKSLQQFVEVNWNFINFTWIGKENMNRKRLIDWILNWPFECRNCKVSCQRRTSYKSMSKNKRKFLYRIWWPIIGIILCIRCWMNRWNQNLIDDSRIENWLRDKKQFKKKQNRQIDMNENAIYLFSFRFGFGEIENLHDLIRSLFFPLQLKRFVRFVILQFISTVYICMQSRENPNENKMWKWFRMRVYGRIWQTNEEEEKRNIQIKTKTP